MDNFSAPPEPKEIKAIRNSFGIEWQPWFKTFYRNLRDAIAPPKLPPLRLTSQSVKVRSIWSRDAAFGPSQTLALALHLGFIALLAVPLYNKIASSAPPAIVIGGPPIEVPPYTWRLPPGDKPAQGGGSGGDHNPVPPSAGRLPPFALLQITPPTVTIRNPNPALPAQPTLVGNPNLKISSPDLPNLGDPEERTVSDSNGPGTGDGIGTRHGTGIGGGNGPGFGLGDGGGAGGGPNDAGAKGYGTPSCLYCPDPKYSEAARQVKFMGTVMVQLIVNADGRPSDIVVIKDPGLGLGEKAIEAVKTWQFKPALGPNGKPAATRVNIEVQFRLL
jgi:periplasmic protein TonB